MDLMNSITMTQKKNKIKSVTIIPLAIALLQVVLFTACNKKDVQTDIVPKTKALFAYMIADNDLDFYAVSSINEMERFMANNPAMGNIYVYIDRAKNRATSHPVLYKISADTTSKISSTILRVYPETNSSDDTVFKKILEEVTTISDDNNEIIRGLILWSHGSAWLPNSSLLASNRATDTKSFGVDETTNNGRNFHAEMNIKKLAASLSKHHFDFLLF